MELNLKNKTVVVTGASKGIGFAVAEAFAREGANVLTASRTTTDGLAALGEKFGVVAHNVDLGSADGPKETIERAGSEFGPVDVLVNNVGVSKPREGFLQLDDSTWQSMIELNFLSAVRACRAAIPQMLERGGGAIVNITSLNARSPHPMVVDYSATKAALANLTKSLAEEFTGQGVRVNAVAPGFIRTPMWTEPGGFGEHVAQMLERDDAADVIENVAPEMLGITAGRFAEPEEVADLVTFLASERAVMMTGAEYLVDGGAVKCL
jgi:NAD(P)-dependent dehydrogenase (short-subunit alcohol dehydrogenase family)